LYKYRSSYTAGSNGRRIFIEKDKHDLRTVDWQFQELFVHSTSTTSILLLGQKYSWNYVRTKMLDENIFPIATRVTNTMNESTDLLKASYLHIRRSWMSDMIVRVIIFVQELSHDQIEYDWTECLHKCLCLERGSSHDIDYNCIKTTTIQRTHHWHVRYLSTTNIWCYLLNSQT
jgi:hypothetical protein